MEEEKEQIYLAGQNEENTPLKITIGKTKVEVTDEIYYWYNHYENKDKYQVRRSIKNGDVFFSMIIPKLYPMTISAEDAALHNLLIEAMWKAISELSESDRQLIIGLFFYGKTERHMARLQRCSHQRINKRKEKILERLRKKIQFF